MISPPQALPWEVEQPPYRANLMTPMTAMVFISALIFWLTAIIGIWAAYDVATALIRFGLITVGLGLMGGIAWHGYFHAKTVLSHLGLGCAAVAAVLSLVNLLGLRGNSGMVAGTLIVLLPLGAVGIWWQWQLDRQWAVVVGAIALAIAALTLLLSRERTAWFGLLAGLCCAGYVAWRFASGNNMWRHRAADIILGLVALVGMTLYGAILFGASNAMVGIVRDMFAERISLWQESLALVRDYRFTGSGLGATAMVYSTYVFLVHVPFLYHAHNLFLQIALEQGLPGLVAFVGMTLPVLTSLPSIYRQLGSYSRPFCLATLTALVALGSYGLLDSELYATNTVSIIFAPLGFALTLHWAQINRRFLAHGGDRLPSVTTTSVMAVGSAGFLPILAVVLVCSWPGSLTALHVNLGAVAQTKAELGRYYRSFSPIQDVLRRNDIVDLSAARAQYNQALALDSANVTAHQRLGQIALSQGAYAVALEHLQLAYAGEPQRDAIRLLLGEAYAVTGQVEQAAALWQTIAAVGNVLHERHEWYVHLNATQEAERIGAVIAKIAK